MVMINYEKKDCRKKEDRGERGTCIHPAVMATMASAYVSTPSSHSKTHAAITRPIAVEFTPCKNIWGENIKGKMECKQASRGSRGSRGSRKIKLAEKLSKRQATKKLFECFD